MKPKRILGAAAGLLAALAAVLVVNALRVTAPPALPPSPSAPPAVAAPVIAAHLSAALRVETVSHEDRALDDPSALLRLHALLAQTYPRVHAALTREVLGGGALLFTWKGSDPALAPAIFAAHQDVVPVEPGTEGAWTEPPFSGAISGGFVWGRGALDDKLSLIALLEAAESLLAEGFAPKRTVFLAFGCDEEVLGERGAKVIVETLAARGVHAEYAIDEGMVVTEGILPGVAPPVAVIGLGEKGFASIELSVRTEGGHSSMPPAETTIGILAGAVSRVAATPLPSRMTDASRRSMAALAPYLPFGQRLAAANLWLLEPLVRRSMERKDVTAALVRTTTAPTIFHSGVKENVLPSHARAVVNFRVLPGDTVEGVAAHVRRVVADPRVEVRIQRASEPPPISSADTDAYHRIERAIRRSYPSAVVAPGLVLGATDGRHYSRVAGAVYRFAPMVLRGTEDRDRLHGTNERIPVADLEAAVTFYRDLLSDR